jgi:outer membrane immunogenic protein
MRTKIASLFVAAFSLGIVQAASAADIPVKTPAPALYNWTGFYGGLNAGYAWADPTVVAPVGPSGGADLGLSQTSFPYQTFRFYRRRAGGLQLAGST